MTALQPHGPIAAEGVETLAARAAVCELPKVYALGIDLRDEAMVSSVFVPEAPIRGMLGEERAREYIPELLAGVANYEATMHDIADEYAIFDGDEALVWSYAVALHLAAPESDRSDLAMGVRYRIAARAPIAAGWSPRVKP